MDECIVERAVPRGFRCAVNSPGYRNLSYLLVEYPLYLSQRNAAQGSTHQTGRCSVQIFDANVCANNAAEGTKFDTAPFERRIREPVACTQTRDRNTVLIGRSRKRFARNLTIDRERAQHRLIRRILIVDPSNQLELSRRFVLRSYCCEITRVDAKVVIGFNQRLMVVA